MNHTLASNVREFQSKMSHHNFHKLNTKDKMDEYKDSLSNTSSQTGKASSHSRKVSTRSKQSSARSKAEINKAQLLCRQNAMLKMQALEKKELKLRQEKELLDIQTEMEMNDIVLQMEGRPSNACSEDSLELSLPEEEKYDAVKKWLKIDPQGVHNHKSKQQQPTFQVGLGLHADTQEGLPQLMSQVGLNSQQLTPQEGMPKLTPQVGPLQLTPQVDPQQLTEQLGPHQLMQQEGPPQLTPQVGPHHFKQQEGPQQPQVGTQQLIGLQQEGLGSSATGRPSSAHAQVAGPQ